MNFKAMTLRTLGTALLAVMVTTTSFAGNPDRAGSAGASYLLINPWARTSGLAGTNMASVYGIESTYSNVAGLAFNRNTELIFANTNYLVGADISINTVGFSQRIGTNVVGLSVMSMNFGDIPITTEDLPEGGIGTFSPRYSNLGLHYAKEFSNSIYGGFTMRVLSESISNVRAQGIAFDAGIRYVTGEFDNIRFGISLQNVGPTMRYLGDGLTVTGLVNGTTLTVEQRSARYELPSLVNIGFAYDFLFGENMKLTANGQFTSNSFTRDQFGAGAEFSYKNLFSLRAGYMWEDQIGGTETQTVYNGPAAGFTVQVPTGANGTLIGVDYAYRSTQNFDGIHTIGLHIDL